MGCPAVPHAEVHVQLLSDAQNICLPIFFLAVKTKPIPHIKKNLSQTNFKLKYLLWLFWHLRYILLLLAQLMNVCWDLQTTFILKTTATYILTPM